MVEIMTEATVVVTTESMVERLIGVTSEIIGRGMVVEVVRFEERSEQYIATIFAKDADMAETWFAAKVEVMGVNVEDVLETMAGSGNI